MSRQIYAVCLKCLLSLMLLISIGLPALGQSASSAAVNGIVQDTTDARIPNASVKLINTDTGTESNSTTSKDGIFSIPSVLPGHYRLQIERDGFDTTQLTGITLNVGDNKAVIIRMKVGSTNQTVTVDASGLNINTTDGSVSTVIDRNFVANIPLNGRSFQDLISLTPGVVTQSPQSGSSIGLNGDFSVNGQRTESNNYIIDGVSANATAGSGQGAANPATGGNLGSATALGTTQSLVSVDALQEFRVESSTYSAEYGRSPGGQFSFLTRAGTDKFHGSLFDYIRNNALDANDWFNDYYGKAQAPLRQNDFGGTVGGPVWIPWLYQGKGKTFFFFSYEGLRLSQPTAASLQYVPSTSLRATAPNVLQPILNAFPIPTGPEVQIGCNDTTYQCPSGQPLGTDVPSGLAPFVLPYSLPSRIDSATLRLDHQFGSRIHAFFRAAYTPSQTEERDLSQIEQIQSNMQSYTLGTDAQISSTSNNELRVGLTRAVSHYNKVIDDFGGATGASLSQLIGLGSYPNGNAEVGLSFSGVGGTSLGSQDTANYSNQWDVVDVVSWTRGVHTIKGGADYHRIFSPFAPSDPQGSFEYYSPTSILTNSADNSYIYRQAAAEPAYDQLALWGQDEWRLTSRLNLSAGLRWELEPPPSSESAFKPYPLRGNPNDPSTYVLGVPGQSLYNTTWSNFAPRLGIAWSINNTHGRETVARAGGGIFYDTGTSSYGEIDTVSGSASYSHVPVPLTAQQLDISLVPTPLTEVLYFVSPTLQMPVTTEWSAALQQGLGQQQSVTISYIGENGRRLVKESVIDAGQTNPQFGYLLLFGNGLTSNYQSLQVQLQRQVSHGLGALASYTWSHSLDYGSEDGKIGFVRGNSDFDVRNSFNTALSWKSSTKT